MKKASDKPNIPPRETYYKGYRFRSRLEARWAVFFDALGIRYEYEWEGFRLKGHGSYLPDFWLPDLKYWVEIKPEVNIEVAQKPGLFSQEAGVEILVCGGLPECAPFNDFTRMWLITTPPDGPLCECGCGRHMAWNDDCVRFYECERGYIHVGIFNDPQNITPDKILACITPRLVAAYAEARQARFEFGEKGRR